MNDENDLNARNCHFLIFTKLVDYAYKLEVNNLANQSSILPLSCLILEMFAFLLRAKVLGK